MKKDSNFYWLIIRRYFPYMPDTINTDDHILATSTDRLEMIVEKLRKFDDDLVSPIRIESVRFDKTGLAVADKVIINYEHEDEDEDE